MRSMIYDCEIIKGILPEYSNMLPIAGIEYCDGWDDHANMGISVIGTYNSWDKEYVAYVEDKVFNSLISTGIVSELKFKVRALSDFQKDLGATDILVGFNNQHFDDKLIEANGFKIPELKLNYDILAEAWQSLGMAREFVYPSHAGYSLARFCEVNGLKHKSGSGEQAPINWQKGKYLEVINYCMNDIEITRQLFNTIMGNKGWILNPKEKTKLTTVREYIEGK